MNQVEQQCFAGRNPEEMSPWGLFFAYHICAAHVRSDREAYASAEIVKIMREGLLMMDVRWNAAGT